MKFELQTFNNQKEFINGVVLRKLIVNNDESGSLMETMRSDWHDVYSDSDFPFAHSYYSVTVPGIARDEDRWHVHSTKQVDRFLVLSGNAVIALYDGRELSSTHGLLSLFLMGEENGDENQYLLLIPQGVYHGFCAVGTKPCGLFNFPSHIYDPAEEGRIPIAEVGARFPDGTLFSWQAIREHFAR